MPADAQQRKAALVIGNGAYRHAPALPHPPNDARAVADALRKLGFDVTLALDLDHRGMREALLSFERGLERRPGRRILFRRTRIQRERRELSGAGRRRDPRMRRASAAETVDLTTVFDALDRARRQDRHSRRQPRQSILGKSHPVLGHPIDRREVRLGRDLRADRSLVLMASAPGTVASDGSGPNSPFTSALIGQLAAPGVDVETAMNRVRQDVARATQNRQVPWFQSTLSGEIRLSDPPATKTVAILPSPMPRQRKRQRWTKSSARLLSASNA